jgi:hypothetical protein
MEARLVVEHNFCSIFRGNETRIDHEKQNTRTKVDGDVSITRREGVTH